VTFEVAHTWDGVPVDASERVAVTLVGEPDAIVVVVEAPYHADPPPPGPPGSHEGLWEYEVVELFIAGPADPYVEIELGPHGHFLVLRLHGVRNAIERSVPIAYTATIEGRRWRGVARVPRGLLPVGPHRANAYAIHGNSARRYLCATPLPGARPDFHQPARFPIVTLP
jgi:hypothetical protein